MSRSSSSPLQRSFADLGPPLRDVTFCVVDLETTGGSARTCGITEIGAVKLRGGECLGTFQTLVNPGAAIPPQITILTGITQAMVQPAPRIEQVLPALIEFIGDSVVVGHNVRFDVGFLDEALRRSNRPTLTNQRVDTVALARRLLRDEVPNCRLGTLAERLGLAHRPSHRALDDALATGDLLHLLIERVGALGVTGLDDLIALPKLAGHPQAAKLRLTEGLPRTPGVYLFGDRDGRVLYVGKATNLRARVRSYFSGDERRKVSQMLRETHHIDHISCTGPLEAAVLEVRLIHRHEPRFNAQIKRWGAYTYLKLTAERFPRLSITKHARPDGATYLGPLPSTRFARLVAEAIETAVPIRRCTARPGRTLRPAPCTAAQLGVATCPCAGGVSETDYGSVIDRVIRGITVDPAVLLGPLDDKMRDLANSERFEQAAALRDRAAALASAISRRHRIDDLRRCGRLEVEVPGVGGAELCHGLLVRTWPAGGRPLGDPLPGLVDPPDDHLSLPAARDRVDELMCVLRWFDQHRQSLQVLRTDEPLSARLLGDEPFDLPRFEARRSHLHSGPRAGSLR